MSTEPKLKTPFKLIESDEGLLFEAEFDLPSDGTPTPNKLVVRVELESTSSEVCDVFLIGRTFKDTQIGSFRAPIAVLGNVLYGFASIQHIPQLVLL